MALNVLIIDDEQDIVEVLQDRLEACGFHVSSSVSGPEALNELAREKFDGIFLDLRMPEMDGFEVLDRIRMTDKKIPIIVITASTNKEGALLAQAKGASGYILKPFEWEELKNKIQELYEIEL